MFVKAPQRYIKDMMWKVFNSIFLQKSLDISLFVVHL